MHRPAPDAGGANLSSNGVDVVGGGATASAILTGAKAVSSSVTATGGGSGAGFGSNGHGATANASATVTGTTAVQSTGPRSAALAPASSGRRSRRIPRPAEMGGAHDSNGTKSESITDAFVFSFDPSQLSGAKDLMLGLYHPSQVGTGGSLTFDVTVDGSSVQHQSFASLSAATSYFTNHALDLGSITGFAQGPIKVGVSLQETTTTAGSSLFAGLLLGASHS